MGLFYMSMGLGSFLSSGVLRLLAIPGIQWFISADTGNINFGNLSNVFFVFAGIQVVALALFMIVIYQYEKNIFCVRREMILR